MHRGAVAVFLGGLVLAVVACGALDDKAAPGESGFRVPAVVIGPAVVDDFDLGLLVPPKGRVRRVWSPATDQVLVEWTASRTPSVYADELQVRWGIVLWTRVTSAGFGSKWRSYELPLDKRVGTGAPKIWVRLGDVTSDGRRDVIVAQYPGNHLCGPHRVFATIGRRPRPIFRARFCETYLSARAGRLEIDAAEYEKGDSMCCPSFRRVTIKAWSGRRLVTVSSRRIAQRRF